MVGKRLTSASDFKVGDMVSFLSDSQDDRLRWKGKVLSKKGKFIKVQCGHIVWTIQPSHPDMHIRKVKS